MKCRKEHTRAFTLSVKIAILAPLVFFCYNLCYQSRIAERPTSKLGWPLLYYFLLND
jgi:hypothetical protein